MRLSRTGFIPKRCTPETVIKNEIKRWLGLYGWKVWYNLQGLGSYKGISDLTALKDGIYLWIEVKTNTGKQSPYQKAFQQMIESSGGNYVVARSSMDVENYIKTINT